MPRKQGELDGMQTPFDEELSKACGILKDCKGKLDKATARKDAARAKVEELMREREFDVYVDAEHSCKVTLKSHDRLTLTDYEATPKAEAAE